MDDSQHIISGHLKDFDWQLNLALSSDKLASLNQPLVNVDFDLQTKSTQTSLHSVEMDGDELDKLVAALEQANKALQQAK
ncbi:unnamed protein product [Clavelina lepadiformis]|uniref:COMM domain-containing protein n=1 Tax=Clavelina lepadiformis TaxID=159417 RepID=A0ABP0H427_CLALP